MNYIDFLNCRYWKMVLIHTFALLLVLLLYSTRSLDSSSICDSVCQCQKEMLICKKDIPYVLPDNSTTVMIKDLDFSLYVDKHPFGHESWRQIVNLTISDSDVNEEELSRRNEYTIKSGLFNNSANLEYLAIDSARYTSSATGGFTGLHHLKVLDLSGCHRQTFFDLTPGLTGVQMPNLRHLKLKGFSNLTDNVNSGIIESAFFDVLKNKPITELDLSYTNLYTVDPEALSSAFPHLRKINTEHGRLLVFYFTIALAMAPGGSTFSNIEYINANYPKFPSSMFSLFPDFKTDNARADPIMEKLKDVRLRGIVPKGFSAEFLIKQINDSICPVISIYRQPSIEWVIPFCKRGRNYENVTFEFFDAGDNELVKVAPEVGLLGLNVKTLALSKNKLGDNVNILTKYPLPLTKLILSHNGIKELKKTFFEGLPKLTSLDLSHNLLKHFILYLSDVRNLEHLDISFNHISYIDPDMLVSLRDAFSLSARLPNQSNGIRPHTLNVIVHDNPFQCKCKDKHFIQELLLSDEFIKLESLTCLYKDTTIPISQHTLSKIEDLCREPSIKAAIATCSVLLFLTFFITMSVTCRVHRARREKRRFQNLLHRYRTDPNRPEYPVFLSFSSRDVDLAHRFILPRLNRGLQKILETEDTCVATGDLNFLPGFTVAGEIIRCIEASRVVIFCISEAFCESGYCRDEVMVADYTRTPVILMFLEELETAKLPKLLQKYFYTSTRCKVIKHEGRHVLVPHWDVLCRSIVQLFEGNEY